MNTRSRSASTTGRSRRRSSRLAIGREFDLLTHYLFRYPAKFHPPVARALLERFTDPGDTVLDPFCGSGTLLVEAMVNNRSSIGVDVDPVAALVSKAKVHRYRMPMLRESAERLRDRLFLYERAGAEYGRRMFSDLSNSANEEELRHLRSWVPAIPNIEHWFRRYVIVDLARIRSVIERMHLPDSHRHLFRVVFGSIIRNSSNADPVPVSGLEVTSHMRQRDRDGRYINPFLLFDEALDRALDACADLAGTTSTGVGAKVIRADAAALDRVVHAPVDAVITSPPYHGAVEYYRRHTLEMYWLGATNSTDERLSLLQHYIGRPKVPQSHPYVMNGALKTQLAKRWEGRIRWTSDDRADAFRHYIGGMRRFFDALAPRVSAGAPVALVVGRSSWNNSRIPTGDLFAEIARSHFRLDELFWYPVKNRYMSYARHNGADINNEHVVVLRRRAKRRKRGATRG
ncbi:MAG: TRM11 family SAM-dependent methyltransferase [Actinomycetota bacterium]